MFSLPTLAFVQSQQTPYFKITLIVPGPNPSRKAWAEVIENSLDAAQRALELGRPLYVSSGSASAQIWKNRGALLIAAEADLDLFWRYI